jgi:hypothetical protein
MIHPDLGRALRPLLALRSAESLLAAEQLVAVDNAVVGDIVPWATDDVAKDEVLRGLVASAVAVESNVAFASQVMTLVLKWMSPEQAMVQICSRDFINAPNFACAFIMFKCFEKAMIDREISHVVEYCTVFRDPEAALMDDEERKRLFQDLDDPENIAAVLHRFPRG